MSEIPFVNQLGDAIERAIASQSSTARSRWGLRRGASRLGPFVVLAGSCLIVAGVVAVALGIRATPRHVGAPIRPNHALHHSIPVQSDEASSLDQLVGEYAVLRRLQTAADRVNPGRLNGFLQASGSAPGVGVLATETAIPSLTRVVTSDGVTVALFVARVTPERAVLRNNKVARSLESSAAARSLDQSVRGYELWARIAGEGSGLHLVGLGPGTSALVTGSSEFQAPNGRGVDVVPDDVARVSWDRPRLFDAATLGYHPAFTAQARAHNNLVVAPVANPWPPTTAVWYAASGQVIARIHNPDAEGAQYGIGLSRPGHESPLSREAERDPATPNRVVVVPQTGTLDTTFRVVFHVLLNGRRYGQHITGGPHAGCITPPPYARSGSLTGPSTNLRGDTFQGILRHQVSCPGTYHISVYVYGKGNQAYRPFGSASFTVR